MTTIYTVRYEHKHGTDLIACKTQEIANREALKIVDEYWMDFVGVDCLDDEGELNVPLGHLLDHWFEHTDGSESINVEAMPLLDK